MPFPTVIALIRPSDSLTLFGLGSGSPCLRPTSYECLVLLRLPSALVNSVPSETSGAALRKPPFTRKHQGLPGYWAVLFVRAIVDHLAGRAVPFVPSCWRRPYCLQVLRYLGLMPEFPFRWLNTMAHTLACLRINVVVTSDAARLTTSLPGSALAGRDSHPLDDYSKISRRHRLPPIPFRPALPGRIRRRESRRSNK